MVCTQEGLCVCTVESLDVPLCFTLVTSGTYLEHMNTVLIQMSPAMLSFNLPLLLELLFHNVDCPVTVVQLSYCSSTRIRSS